MEANTRTTYRPDIDGLRAIAVLSVMLYHFDLPLLSVSGGFTGVDVFFVISGYLITRILLADVGNPGGMKTFYLRRFWRIYPALLIVVAASLLAGYFMLVPGDYADLGESSRFTLFAFGNLYFHGHTGYFDQAAELQPLLHTWSLAVEEQFYFVWPLIVLAALRAGGRRAVAIACIAIMLASFMYSNRLVGWNDQLAFYSSISRAWELALGALVVFLPTAGWRKPAAELIDWIGISLIGFSCFGLSDASSFPGPNALYACIGSALIIWPKTARTSVARCLAARPISGVGLISYSLYLWHWPVLVFGLHYFGEQIPPFEAVMMFAAVFGVAVLSWRYVEQPFRRREFPEKIRELVSTSAVMVLTVFATVVMLSNGLMGRLPERALAMSDLRVMWEWEPEQRSFEPFSDHVVFGAPWWEADYRIVVWGDSYAQHMAPLIERTVVSSAHQISVSVLLYRACPAIVDGQSVYLHSQDAQFNRRCGEDRERLMKFLASGSSQADRVVLVSSWRNLAVRITPDGDFAKGFVSFRSSLPPVVDELLTYVPSVTLIGQTPGWARDPVPCVLAKLASFPRHDCPESFPQLDTAQLDEYFFAVNTLLGEIAQGDPRVSSIDPLARWCDESTCRSEVDGHFIYRDRGHLRRNLPVNVRSELAEALGLNQLLPSEQDAYASLASGSPFR